jgi:hypothetical protein
MVLLQVRQREAERGLALGELIDMRIAAAAAADTASFADPSPAPEAGAGNSSLETAVTVDIHKQASPDSSSSDTRAADATAAVDSSPAVLSTSAGDNAGDSAGTSIVRAGTDAALQQPPGVAGTDAADGE